MKTNLFLLAFLIYVVVPSHAALKVVGKGSSLAFDTSNFPPQMKASYEIMKNKCTKCHSLERTIVAVTSGIGPISGQPFDRKATEAYGAKMKRKPESNMNAREVKDVVELLNYLIVKNARQ